MFDDDTSLDSADVRARVWMGADNGNFWKKLAAIQEVDVNFALFDAFVALRSRSDLAAVFINGADFEAGKNVKRDEGIEVIVTYSENPVAIPQNIQSAKPVSEGCGRMTLTRELQSLPKCSSFLLDKCMGTKRTRRR